MLRKNIFRDLFNFFILKRYIYITSKEGFDSYTKSIDILKFFVLI